MIKNQSYSCVIRIVILLFLCGALLSACGGTGDPETIFQSLNDALNAGDIDTALSYLSDDANVFINPERDFHGKDEIRGWYEFLVADNTSVEISNFQIDGETCTWDWKVAGDGIRAGGNEFLLVTMEGAVMDGKVQYYKITGAK